jgi:hypothetical protein
MEELKEIVRSLQRQIDDLHKKDFSVLLLLPVTCWQDKNSAETFYCFEIAVNATEAANQAQQRAIDTHGLDPSQEFDPLLITNGHHEAV